MNGPRNVHPKNILPECHFPACKAPTRLLKTALETERNPFQGGVSSDSPACSSIDQFQVTPQAGEVLPEWFRGSRRSIRCGLSALEPQDRGIDKQLEKSKLMKRGQKMPIFGRFLRFAPRFLRGNHGANKTNRSPHKHITPPKPTL
jgi:hypothetical protein